MPGLTPEPTSVIHMKNAMLLLLLVSLAIAFTGCSNYSPAAGSLNVYNFGVVNVSDGKPISHVLADGRVCTLAATALPNGNVCLTTLITTTNTSERERQSAFFQSPVYGQPITFGADHDTTLIVTLQK